MKVIIRSDKAGVFYGTLESKESTVSGVEVTLTNCRRIWYWEGAATLSQLAVEGTKSPKQCKITIEVPSMTIMNVVEIIPCSEEAIASLDSVPVWKA